MGACVCCFGRYHQAPSTYLTPSCFMDTCTCASHIHIQQQQCAWTPDLSIRSCAKVTRVEAPRLALSTPGMKTQHRTWAYRYCVGSPLVALLLWRIFLLLLLLLQSRLVSDRGGNSFSGYASTTHHQQLLIFKPCFPQLSVAKLCNGRRFHQTQMLTIARPHFTSTNISFSLWGGSKHLCRALTTTQKAESHDTNNDSNNKQQGQQRQTESNSQGYMMRHLVYEKAIIFVVSMFLLYDTHSLPALLSAVGLDEHSFGGAICLSVSCALAPVYIEIIYFYYLLTKKYQQRNRPAQVATPLLEGTPSQWTPAPLLSFVCIVNNPNMPLMDWMWMCVVWVRQFNR